MKRILRAFVLRVLKILAKKRLSKYQGKIVAVTGSIGKTSTKDAIFKVLNTQFRVRRSQKSMNSEFGLLLTILDIDSGYSNAGKWVWYLFKAFLHSMSKDTSDILLLEYGVDKPGDMDFLISVAKPDIAVVTSIAPVHLAEGQFKSLDEIFEEKSKLAFSLRENGVAILNIDNEYLESLSKKIPKRRILTYGVNSESGFRISSVSSDISGIRFSLFNKDQRVALEAPVLGDFEVYVLSPAYICGHVFGMKDEDIAEALKRFSLPPGRMNVIEGINDITMIDASYNSSPEALKEALNVLDKVAQKGQRKVAILGQMNELGDRSRDLHMSVGESLPKYCDILIAVGGDAKYFKDAAISKGMDEKSVFFASNVKEASRLYEGILKKGDLLLVKGSQNRVRLERFVKDFMANPEMAKELLVRQEKEWSAIL
jgi:UDP-N-acetylmuramoyl-tripeptide--D-alanyl-D-alanine ligase